MEAKVITGKLSVSKKSADVRCVSRSALPVSIEASCTVACTEEVSKLSPTRTVASNSLNWPRTLLTMRCRATKPTSLCEGSTVQVPGESSETLVMAVLLGHDGGGHRRPGSPGPVLVLNANSGMFKFQLMTGKLLP